MTKQTTLGGKETRKNEKVK